MARRWKDEVGIEWGTNGGRNGDDGRNVELTGSDRRRNQR